MRIRYKFRVDTIPLTAQVGIRRTVCIEDMNLFGRRSSKVDQTPEAAEKLAERRSVLQGMILMNGLDRKPFAGAEWPYFFTDLRDEAQAAKVALPDGSVHALASSLDAFPADAVLRLFAAYFAYITPLQPERENYVDELLSVFDRAGAQRMRKRRAAVQALIVAQERDKALRLAEANRRLTLEVEHMRCPRGRLDLKPDEFLRWVQAQTPDTWHLVMFGWEYDDDSYNSALSWILDQPQCDVGTAARFFFFAATGLATGDPEKLRSYHRAQWELMKKAADLWSAGHYLQSELDPGLDGADVAWFDGYAADRLRDGRPLAFAIPAPTARSFGTRWPQSGYAYHGGGRVGPSFEVWLKSRERSGSCGKNYPACCGD